MSRKGKGAEGVAAALLEKLKDVPVEKLTAIVERCASVLSAEEHETLKEMVDTVVSQQQLLTLLREELNRKNTSIARMKRMVFGASTEKTATVLDGKKKQGASDPSESQALTAEREKKTRPKGHGRNGVAAFSGAQHIKVEHPMMASGEGCLEEGCTGRLYRMKDPRTLLRITGVAPLCACVYELARWRCNLCGRVYTAPAPPEAGDDKYDVTVAPMIGLIKYGAGLPFYRNEKLQAAMRMPIPASTQWDIVKAASEVYAPLHEVLIDLAADCRVLFNDDTTMQVLKLTRAERAAAISDDEEGRRTGIYNSGIVATAEGYRIALFFTGARHAGENLEEVLKRRDIDLPPPIQMCDASAMNTDGEFASILCRCLSHARRRCVDVVASFPEEVAFVLNTLKAVYATDAQAKAHGLSPKARLDLHKAESEPRMTALKSWIDAQFADRKVDPNSTLGDALEYMSDHWVGLTAFLRTEAAPLDNNITEQALKRVVLFRKNSLFYRTLKGAAVGDRFMTLIHTCELNDVNPFEYLVALLRHAEVMAQDPKAWLPWNYKAALAGVEAFDSRVIDVEASPPVTVPAAGHSAPTLCQSNGALA